MTAMIWTHFPQCMLIPTIPCLVTLRRRRQQTIYQREEGWSSEPEMRRSGSRPSSTDSGTSFTSLTDLRLHLQQPPGCPLRRLSDNSLFDSDDDGGHIDTKKLFQNVQRTACKIERHMNTLSSSVEESIKYNREVFEAHLRILRRIERTAISIEHAVLSNNIKMTANSIEHAVLSNNTKVLDLKAILICLLLTQIGMVLVLLKMWADIPGPTRSPVCGVR